MVVRYDFGDNWDHQVTVIGSEPGDAAPLHRRGRCRTARGLRRRLGLDRQVQAANNPRHPDHADIRDWLDLADGETLDPKAFDLRATDDRPTALRTPGGRRGRGR